MGQMGPARSFPLVGHLCFHPMSPIYKCLKVAVVPTKPSFTLCGWLSQHVPLPKNSVAGLVGTSVYRQSNAVNPMPSAPSPRHHHFYGLDFKQSR